MLTDLPDFVSLINMDVMDAAWASFNFIICSLLLDAVRAVLIVFRHILI